MALTNDELGDLAEAEFKRWTAQRGLVANKSDRDRTGWDYIVDFPAEEGGGPADHTPPWATARVQVKGMGRGVERKSVKLSNWAHAVRNAEPFFFVVIRFDFPEDDVPEVVDVFLVHVD